MDSSTPRRPCSCGDGQTISTLASGRPDWYAPSRESWRDGFRCIQFGDEFQILGGSVQHRTGGCEESCDSFICRSEEHTSELQSLMRISYAVFCLKKKNITKQNKYKKEEVKIDKT